MPYGKDKVVQACHGAHSLSTERLALLLLLFSKYENLGKVIGQNWEQLYYEAFLL